MSSTADKTFNGPFKRAELLLLPQYAASDRFLPAGKWMGTKNHILSLNNSEGEPTSEALYCIVVGTITADRTYLGKHGNFTPKFNEDAWKAKIQFTLARPNDPDFGPDYDKAVIAFEKHQDDISATSFHQFFLSKEDGTTMRMSSLNQRSVDFFYIKQIFMISHTLAPSFYIQGDNIDKEREKETLAYYVGHEYETYWTSARTSNYSCIMPVFDTNDAPINPNHFADKLVGATCEITFTLKHYAIGGHKKPDGKWVEANDVFSAQVETVAILKKPPALARSPYKGRLIRKPHHRPQLPTRTEQVNAAEAFVPRLEYKPMISGSDSSGPRTEVAQASTALPSSGYISNPSVIPVTPGSISLVTDINTDVVVAIPTDSTTKTVDTKTISGRMKTKASSTSITTMSSNNGEDDEQPAKKRRTDT